MFNLLFLQSDNWGEVGTAVTTATTEIDYGQIDAMDPNSSMDKWKLLQTDRGMSFRCKRHAGSLMTGLLAMLAFLSPILMVILPLIGVLGLRDKQLQCQVECEGMAVSLSFKLVVLVVGSWAVFFRRPRSTLPRIHIYRAIVCLLIVVFLISFWLFYGKLISNEKETVEYKSLVAFAVSLVDALLFVHYLAVLLMELRGRQAQYYIKVVRSPDGESKGFPIGEMSVQRAAAWVLDKYYTEFPIYNPYLDRQSITIGARFRKGAKISDMDGGTAINVSKMYTHIYLCTQKTFKTA